MSAIKNIVTELLWVMVESSLEQFSVQCLVKVFIPLVFRFCNNQSQSRLFEVKNLATLFMHHIVITMKFHLMSAKYNCDYYGGLVTSLMMHQASLLCKMHRFFFHEKTEKGNIDCWPPQDLLPNKTRECLIFSHLVWLLREQNQDEAHQTLETMVWPSYR